jgi:hypothetical protein
MITLLLNSHRRCRDDHACVIIKRLYAVDFRACLNREFFLTKPVSPSKYHCGRPRQGNLSGSPLAENLAQSCVKLNSLSSQLVITPRKMSASTGSVTYSRRAPKVLKLVTAKMPPVTIGN